MTGNQNTRPDGQTDGAATGQQGRVRGKPLAAVVPIEDEATRITVEDFATPASPAGVAVAHPMAPIADGATERASGDVTEGRGRSRQAVDTLDYVQDIMATLREPVLVLSGDLRVISANRSFYRVFQTVAEETEHQLIYELGRGQWDIPDLRLLLEAVLLENHYFDDFKVEHSMSDEVEIRVSDQGIGIPASDLEHIFERFYRGSEVSKRFSGMGIGLFLCKRIVEEHRGHIWAESDGHGSEIVVRLPIVWVAAP